jgi:hypothetical protein
LRCIHALVRQQIFALSLFRQISVLGVEAAIFLPLSNRVWAQVRSDLMCSFSLLSRLQFFSFRDRLAVPDLICHGQDFVSCAGNFQLAPKELHGLDFSHGAAAGFFSLENYGFCAEVSPPLSKPKFFTLILVLQCRCSSWPTPGSQLGAHRRPAVLFLLVLRSGFVKAAPFSCLVSQLASPVLILVRSVGWFGSGVRDLPPLPPICFGLYLPRSHFRNLLYQLLVSRR